MIKVSNAISVNDIVKANGMVFTVTEIRACFASGYVRVVGVDVDGKVIQTKINTSGSFQIWE